MKTIVSEEPGQFRLLDTEPPQQADANSALVRVLRVGICGTNLHVCEGTQPFFSYPRILGPELAGEILPSRNATVQDFDWMAGLRKQHSKNWFKTSQAG